MIPYKELKCANLLKIQEETISFLESRTTLISNPCTRLWNKINTAEFLKASPALLTFVQSLGLKIREAAITVVNDRQGAGLHIDELPVTAKINIPILNTKGSRNLWYTVPNLSDYKPIINPFGAKYYDLSAVDLNTCTKVADVELIAPIVFNSQIPHMVTVDTNQPLPRIVLSITFFNEPIDFLLDTHV